MSGPDQWVVLLAAAPAKPARGSPCNGCGVCCAAEPCPLAMLRFRRRRGACPALHWSEAGGRYVCGLLAAPEQHFRPLPAVLAPPLAGLVARAIAAGSGCDSDSELV